MKIEAFFVLNIKKIKVRLYRTLGFFQVRVGEMKKNVNNARSIFITKKQFESLLSDEKH
jgi:hypothetical protein